MNKFEYEDLQDANGREYTGAKLQVIISNILARCPHAILCRRHCDGTDFPDFLTIESPEYHKMCNKKGEFVLTQIIKKY